MIGFWCDLMSNRRFHHLANIWFFIQIHSRSFPHRHTLVTCLLPRGKGLLACVPMNFGYDWTGQHSKHKHSSHSPGKSGGTWANMKIWFWFLASVYSAVPVVCGVIGQKRFNEGVGMARYLEKWFQLRACATTSSTLRCPIGLLPNVFVTICNYFPQT